MASPPSHPHLIKTQAYVDPLIGTKFGAYTFVKRAGEGRFGTLYLAEDDSKARVTLQVLRTELVGNEQEMSAANALKNPGIAKVLSLGVLPDGRHVRVLEFLDGRSLDDAIHTSGKFAPADVIEVLAKLLEILQNTHTWHIAHGRLGPSSVVRVGPSLKLLDFGFARGTASVADDLKAVGSLGFTLLAGKDVDAAPPPNDAVPERLHRLLSELLAGRIESAASARRELDWLRPAASARKSRRFVMLGVLVIAIVGAGVWFSQRQLQPQPVAAETPTPAPEPEPDAGVVAAVVEEVVDAGAPPEPIVAKPFIRKTPRTELPPKNAPSADALEKQFRVFEAKLRKNKKLKADEVEEALHVLNKQRLRLSGSVTEEDRRDISAKLAAWKRVWLH